MTTSYPIRTIIRWLWQSSSDNRLQAILNTIIGLLETAVSLASVWAVKHAIDIASHHIEGSIIHAMLIMAALILSTLLLRVAAVWVRNILGIKAQNRMQQRMLSTILRSQFQGRDSIHSGDMLNRLEQDVSTVVNFVAETLPDMIAIIAMFLGAFAYLFILDHTLAIAIVVLFPIFLLLSKVYVRKMRQLNRDVRESDSAVQSILQESVQNRVLVKTLESEDVLVERLDEQHQTLRRKVVKKTYFSVFSNFLVSAGFASGYLLAFAWSAFRLSAGTLTYGGMSAFLQLVNRIQNPAHSLARLVPKFVAVFTAAERLMAFEDVPMEQQGDPILLPGCCGVRFEDVTYAYSDEPDHNIIEHLSFDFKPGTCTAIVGPTGAGKTTLLRMILALVKPVSGNVYIYNKVEETQRSKLNAQSSKLNAQSSKLNAQSLKLNAQSLKLNAQSLKLKASPQTRCNIIYVPQGNTLLSGTIRDNLLLGNVDATEEQMFEALNTACADFVSELPEGIDTAISEQGGGLSEGQAQRICIARALLRQCSLMILDEATSALDADTEQRLLHNILQDRQHTVIFITHRPAVLQYCDQTLRIEH